MKINIPVSELQPGDVLIGNRRSVDCTVKELIPRQGWPGHFHISTTIGGFLMPLKQSVKGTDVALVERGA